MPDTRIFRVTKGKYGRAKTTYHTRTSVSAMYGTSLYHQDAGRPDILSVECTNAEATEGWTDVTNEFRYPEKPAVVCPYHKHYTGVQKPNRSNPSWYHQECKCWKIYCSKHPDYPTHWDLCDRPSNDPAKCACQLTKKFMADGNEPGIG